MAVDFDRSVRPDPDAILASGYRPTAFQRMLAEYGAVETAKRLLAAPGPSDGFRHLWEHGLLRHSIESAVLQPAFEPLFTEAELDAARRRLLQAGFCGGSSTFPRERG
jgi:hypothetical protein